MILNSNDCEIELLARQLQADEKQLAEGQPVSDAALKAPRIDSGEDKKSGLGRQLARQLFPTSEDERIGSYIAYSRLISRLRGAYKAQMVAADASHSRPTLFQQARMFGNRKLFEQLLSEPLSDTILNPLPMPVEIAPYEELEPFLTHMRKGEAASQSCLEFTRGAYYDDGRIDMCKQVVGDRYIGDLVNSVRDNPFVEHFLLGNNIVGDRGAAAIASLISGSSQARIKTYYLAGNCFTAIGARSLATALSNNQQAESLWLKRNPPQTERSG